MKKIKHVVISPGSRNAPLVNLFASHKYFKLHSIVDERAAAFYALGIALANHEAVIILCTSGTAVLNYSPALAEAYYRHVPLIAITADRPEHLIDQQDNQTIRQKNIYANFIKQSIHLHTPVSNMHQLNALHHDIQQAINTAESGTKGPVHINVPIAEPLYIAPPLQSKSINEISTQSLTESNLDVLLQEWKKSTKTMILIGQGEKNDTLNQCLNIIAEQQQAVVVAEPVSNIHGQHIITTVERLMMQIDSENIDNYAPQLLISAGGAIVSKRLKKWLQQFPELMHIRLSNEVDGIDTYKNLKATVTGNINTLFDNLHKTSNTIQRKYCESWRNIAEKNSIKHLRFMKSTPWSDLSAMHTIIKNLPHNCALHLGNSTPVRYAQLFNLNKCSQVHANRGVSGIDGSVSTAAGFASQSSNINLLIVGDLSFVYDSNALWNKKLPKNLRIVVVNNQGGGIFHLLPGAKQTHGFEEYIETKHPVNIQKITEAFGLSYHKSQSVSELEKTFDEYLNAKTAALLEVFTPPEINPEVYANYAKEFSKT